MYSKKSWGGPVDPYIRVKFTDVGKDQGDDPIVSLLIFDWMDQDYIGIDTPDDPQKIGICEPQYVEAGFCNQTDIGKFILSPNATEKSVNYILTKAMHLKDSAPIKYPITKTGYFCVVTENFPLGSEGAYEAVVEFRNAYGELPATQIPKLPFYGGITIAYAVVLVFWGFLYFQHRTDICRLPASFSTGFPLLTVHSGRAELYNGDSHLPRHRDVDDLGLLRYVFLATPLP
jgi:hypothetical protein